jgi:hypothetical protein
VNRYGQSTASALTSSSTPSYAMFTKNTPVPNPPEPLEPSHNTTRIAPDLSPSFATGGIVRRTRARGQTQQPDARSAGPPPRTTLTNTTTNTRQRPAYAASSPYEDQDKSGHDSNKEEVLKQKRLKIGGQRQDSALQVEKSIAEVC